MARKKGIAHILVIAVVLLLVVAIPLLIIKFVFKKKLPFIDSKKPNVELKASYKNPFDRNSQYVNPFEEFKNPFLAVAK